MIALHNECWPQKITVINRNKLDMIMMMAGQIIFPFNNSSLKIDSRSFSIIKSVDQIRWLFLSFFLSFFLAKRSTLAVIFIIDNYALTKMKKNQSKGSSIHDLTKKSNEKKILRNHQCIIWLANQEQPKKKIDTRSFIIMKETCRFICWNHHFIYYKEN